MHNDIKTINYFFRIISIITSAYRFLGRKALKVGKTEKSTKNVL